MPSSTLQTYRNSFLKDGPTSDLLSRKRILHNGYVRQLNAKHSIYGYIVSELDQTPSGAKNPQFRVAESIHKTFRELKEMGMPGGEKIFYQCCKVMKVRRNAHPLVDEFTCYNCNKARSLLEETLNVSFSLFFKACIDVCF